LPLVLLLVARHDVEQTVVSDVRRPRDATGADVHESSFASASGESHVTKDGAASPSATSSRTATTRSSTASKQVTGADATVFAGDRR
jgi:hypothetical protein